MDREVLKLFADSIKEINLANIEINKKKDRNIFILFIITSVIFGLCLLYSIYQTYNYEGYPQTDIKNVNTNTNINEGGR